MDCEAIRNIIYTYPLNHWSMNTMDYPPFLTAFPVGKGSSIPMLDYEKKYSFSIDINLSKHTCRLYVRAWFLLC